MGRNSKYYEAVEKAKKNNQINSSNERNDKTLRHHNPPAGGDISKNTGNERSDLEKWSKYYVNEDKFTDYAPYGRNKNGTPFNKDGRPIGGGAFDKTGFDSTGKSDLRRYEDTIISKNEWNNLGRAFDKYFVKENREKDRDDDNRLTPNPINDFQNRYYDKFLRQHQSRERESNKAFETYEKILNELKIEYQNKRQSLLTQKEETLRQNYVENELHNQNDYQRFASMGITDGDEYMDSKKSNDAYNLKRKETIKNYDEKLRELEAKSQKDETNANDYLSKQSEKNQK